MSGRHREESWVPKRSVSPYQAYAFVFNTVIGVGVLVFPRTMAAEVGTDGILVIPLVGIIAGFLFWVITKLGQRFPGETIIGISKDVLGSGNHPWAGRVLSIPFLALFIFYWVMSMGVVTRTFGQVLVSAVFQKTPVDVIMLMLIAAAGFVSHSRLDVLARFNEFLLPLVYLPGILLLAALFQQGEVEHLLPLFQADWKQIAKGISTTIFSYSGFEMALIFMAAYQQPKKAVRSHLVAILVIAIPGYWLTYVASLAVFGKEELTRLAWPVLELVKTVQVPGMILERVESAVLSIWVIAVFTTLTNAIFTIVHALHASLGLADRRRKWLTLAVSAVIYGLARWPENIYEVNKWAEWTGFLWLFATIFVPSLLYVIAWIRGKKGEDGHAPPAP